MKRLALLLFPVPMLIAPNKSAHDHIGDFNWALEIEGVTQGALGSGPDEVEIEVELDDLADSDIVRIRLHGTPAVLVRGNPHALETCVDPCEVQIVSQPNSDDVTYVITLHVIESLDVPDGTLMKFDTAYTTKFIGDEATPTETTIEP